VDHVIPGQDHSLVNLRGICQWHHARKSAQEGVAARRERAEILFRKPEVHPGLIPPAKATPPPNRGF
jgi:hypothetical protein